MVVKQSELVLMGLGKPMDSLMGSGGGDSGTRTSLTVCGLSKQEWDVGTEGRVCNRT